MMNKQPKNTFRSLNAVRSYYFKYDRASNTEYRIFSDGTKEVVQSGNQSQSGDIDEHIDWDAFAHKIASTYDCKVKELMDLNWKDWRIIRNLNFRWWKFWKLWTYFKLKRKIANYKDKMSKDNLKFIDIDRAMTLALQDKSHGNGN